MTPDVLEVQDVQYGPAVASVYDSLIALAMPAEDAIVRLRPYLAGARVLEIGVGTGRVAVLAAAIADRLVGVDNSAPMLEEFRAKGVPANVELVEADFRRPLPFGPEFAAAYSTMGSLACVRSRAELIASLGHVRDVLVPGGSLSLEYYSASAYRPLVELRTVTVPTPHHGGASTFTITLDEADVLTIETRVETDSAPPVHFSEQVLLIGPAEVQTCLLRAGFVVEHVHMAVGVQPYDWYIARSVNE